MMLNRNLSLFGLLVIAVFTMTMMIGCGSDEAEPTVPDTTAGLPTGLILTAAPAGQSIGIPEVKANSKVGDEVIVRVVTGGSADGVFMDDRAVVKVVDAALDNPCLAEGHGCKTPWDYCCTPNDELLPQSATIKVVDAQDKTLGMSLKTGQIKELSTLVVQGVVAPGSNENNLVINAQGIFVEN
ncbi:MAG: hypothetical protein GY869_30175 [Planctomycetes bacterium]|nr:hypothetical protein [Planctomycetota bacterium]